MIIRVFDDNNSLARAAASQAAAAIRTAIALRGGARIVAATGASQFAFLEELTAVPSIDWKRVELFHLDEYIGLPMNQPASFCKYLQERLMGKTGITNCHLMKGDANPAEVIRLTTEAILQSPIDVLSSASAKTAISLSTIRPPISKPKTRTSSSRSTKRAAVSRWPKDGSKLFPMFPTERFPCPYARF